MPTYRHSCRDCDVEWDEQYSVGECSRLMEAGENLACPECESTDTYRQVTDSGAVHFKGAGWSPDGYYKNGAYDTHKEQGKSVKLYDRKEDIDRDMRGEAELAERARLKRVDEAARRHIGPDAGLTQSEADTKIKAAGEKAVNP